MLYEVKKRRKRPSPGTDVTGYFAEAKTDKNKGELLWK
jgi:hypothetical protein